MNLPNKAASSTHTRLHNRANPAPFTLADHGQHLGYWVIIRTLVLIFLGMAAIVCLWQDTIELPFTEILIALLILASVNLLTFSRLRQQLPVTDVEFFIQLLIDLACLTAVLYFSGGANNPFVSYFLVPICIAAATLNSGYTLSIAGLSIISYSSLLFFNVPLPALAPHHYHTGSNLNLHVVGMWLNFFISAGLITYFVVKMARDLRLQEARLNRWREDQLRDEQVMAVATLAAGTAHELGTPLSSMKLLLNELRDEYRSDTQLQKDLALLQEQVSQCSTILRNLVATAEQTKDGQASTEQIGHYCKTLLEHWQLMRPDVVANIHLSNELPEIECQFHPTIAQAILNLLNNAADASPEQIQIDIRWDTQNLYWTITDEGPGIHADIQSRLGKSFVSTKNKGMGIGLVLTQATISRYGGEVRLYNRPVRGAITDLVLPLKSPSVMSDANEKN
jgi:two-component system sensor histidine kinase RegB